MPLFLYFSGSGHFAIRPPWPASHHTCCRRTQCSQRSQCKCVHRPAGAAPSRRAAEARCAPSCHSPRCMPGLPVSRITTDGNHVGRVAGSADGIACGRRGRTYSPAHPAHARLRRALTRPAQSARLTSHSCCPPGPGDRRAVVRRVGGRVRGGRCGWRARRGRGRGAVWWRQHDGRAHGRRAEPGAQAHLAHGRDGNERRCNQAADRLHLRAGRAPASLPRARCLLPGAAGEPAPPVRAGGSLASGAAIGVFTCVSIGATVIAAGKITMPSAIALAPSSKLLTTDGLTNLRAHAPPAPTVTASRCPGALLAAAHEHPRGA
jgi:hypothetical protein